MRLPEFSARFGVFTMGANGLIPVFVRLMTSTPSMTSSGAILAEVAVVDGARAVGEGFGEEAEVAAVGVSHGRRDLDVRW